jgi:hypothetical protein
MPAMAQAASEKTPPQTPGFKSMTHRATEATNPRDPSDPANLIALAGPTSKPKDTPAAAPLAAVSEQSASVGQITPASSHTSNDGSGNETIVANTVLQETNNVLLGLTPAPIAVVEAPNVVVTPGGPGTPEVASPTLGGADGIGLIPAPTNATPRSLDNAPGSGGTPEIATPVAPVLPPVETAPTPEPAPTTQPKAPETPAPTPEAKKEPTAQDDYMQASQDIIDAGGAWVNRGVAMRFFIDKGLSPSVAAAIVGNFMQEATPAIDPTIAQPHGLGRGIGQWSVGGRFDTDNLNLVAFAQSKGKPWTDYNTQLEFVWAELGGPYKHVLNQLQSAGRDRTAATAIVSSQYEGAGVPELQTRIRYTNQVADKFNTYYQAILDKRTPTPASAPLIGWPSTGPDAMKLFNQCDPRWGNILSPNGLRTCNIACGPTNVAMAVDILKPELAITPKETIDYANANKLWFTPAGGAPDSGGTTFDAIIRLAGNWGVSGNEMARAKLKDFETYKQILQDGGVIIAAGSGPTPFVDASIGAHFVMIRGVTSDGKFLVADPYPKTPDTNTVAWDANQMMHSIFGAVVLYNADGIKPTSTTEKPLDATRNHVSSSDRGEEGTKSSSVLTAADIPAVMTPATNESSAQQAVDRAKRAVAAAKAATEQARHEKQSVK